MAGMGAAPLAERHFLQGMNKLVSEEGGKLARTP